MSSSSISGSMHVEGTLSMGTLVPSLTCILDKHVSAASPLGGTKTTARIRVPIYQDGTAADDTIGAAIITGLTGTLLSVSACHCGTANVGDSTVAVDIHKNGTTALSAVATLTSADAQYAIQSGTISSAALVVGDVLEIDINATVGTGTLGTDLLVQLVFDEAPV